MDRDFIIGMVLIFVILFGWQYLSPKPEEPVPTDNETAAAAPQTPAMVSAPTPEAPPAFAEAPAPGTEPDVVVPKPAVQALPPKPPVALSGDLVEAEFTNVGGRIKSWRLRHFNDVAGPEGKPLEMVSVPESGKYPLATYWVGSGPAISEKDTYELVERGPDRVVFRRTDAAGFVITKILEPDFSKYLVTMTVKIAATSAAGAQGRLSVNLYQEMVTSSRSFFKPNIDVTSFLGFIGGDLERAPVEKAAGENYPGNVIWAGFENIYFLSAVAPEVTEKTQAQVMAPEKAGDPLATTVTMPETLIPAGGEASFQFTAYFGPKSEEPLIAAGHGFDQAVDFGWFTAIAKFLVRVLQFFHKVTGNWGVAIIIVTVIIKVLLLPLTHKSYKSMKEMGALQPEMQKIREKYKDDREKMNQEMMTLYKAHGVNPASGCLPMLMQLPIFLAFYRALYGTIELRHSPFMLWIQDLSAPDPYYVLPIIMGGTMLVTQKLTPSSADPMQQKIMMFMPIIFTVMFLGFPSGLVVYWLVNNILTIFQQMYLKRDGKTPPPKAAPAKA